MGDFSPSGTGADKQLPLINCNIKEEPVEYDESADQADCKVLHEGGTDGVKQLTGKSSDSGQGKHHPEINEVNHEDNSHLNITVHKSNNACDNTFLNNSEDVGLISSTNLTIETIKGEVDDVNNDNHNSYEEGNNENPLCDRHESNLNSSLEETDRDISSDQCQIEQQLESSTKTENESSNIQCGQNLLVLKRNTDGRLVVPKEGSNIISSMTLPVLKIVKERSVTSKFFNRQFPSNRIHSARGGARSLLRQRMSSFKKLWNVKSKKELESVKNVTTIDESPTLQDTQEEPEDSEIFQKEDALKKNIMKALTDLGEGSLMEICCQIVQSHASSTGRETFTRLQSDVRSVLDTSPDLFYCMNDVWGRAKKISRYSLVWMRNQVLSSGNVEDILKEHDYCITASSDISLKNLGSYKCKGCGFETLYRGLLDIHLKCCTFIKRGTRKTGDQHTLNRKSVIKPGRGISSPETDSASECDRIRIYCCIECDFEAYEKEALKSHILSVHCSAKPIQRRVTQQARPVPRMFGKRRKRQKGLLSEFENEDSNINRTNSKPFESVSNDIKMYGVEMEKCVNDGINNGKLIPEPIVTSSVGKSESFIKIHRGKKLPAESTHNDAQSNYYSQSGKKELRDKHFDCPKCFNNFYPYDMLLKHLESGNCNKVVKAGHFVKNTDRKVQSFDKTLKCSDCDELFTQKCDLEKHIASKYCRFHATQKRESTNPRNNACPDCGENFLFKYCLNRHRYSKVCQRNIKKRSVGDDLKKLICPDCGEVFVREFNFMRHRNSKRCSSNVLRNSESEKTLFSCPDCNETFQGEGNFLKHRASSKCRAYAGTLSTNEASAPSDSFTIENGNNISSDKEPVNNAIDKYSDCGEMVKQRSTKNQRNTLSYQKNDSDGPVKKCTICKFITTDPEELSLHMKMHVTGSDLFRCSSCGYTIKLSTNPRCKYSCSDCKFRASTRAQLNVHTKSFHSRDGCGYKCVRCGFSESLFQKERKPKRNRKLVNKSLDVNMTPTTFDSQTSIAATSLIEEVMEPHSSSFNELIAQTPTSDISVRLSKQEKSDDELVLKPSERKKLLKLQMKKSRSNKETVMEDEQQANLNNSENDSDSKSHTSNDTFQRKRNSIKATAVKKNKNLGIESPKRAGRPRKRVNKDDSDTERNGLNEDESNDGVKSSIRARRRSSRNLQKTSVKVAEATSSVSLRKRVNKEQKNLRSSTPLSSTEKSETVSDLDVYFPVHLNQLQKILTVKLTDVEAQMKVPSMILSKRVYKDQKQLIGSVPQTDNEDDAKDEVISENGSHRIRSGNINTSPKRTIKERKSLKSSITQSVIRNNKNETISGQDDSFKNKSDNLERSLEPQKDNKDETISERVVSNLQKKSKNKQKNKIVVNELKRFNGDAAERDNDDEIVSECDESFEEKSTYCQENLSTDTLDAKKKINTSLVKSPKRVIDKRKKSRSLTLTVAENCNKDETTDDTVSENDDSFKSLEEQLELQDLPFKPKEVLIELEDTLLRMKRLRDGQDEELSEIVTDDPLTDSKAQVSGTEQMNKSKRRRRVINKDTNEAEPSSDNLSKPLSNEEISTRSVMKLEINDIGLENLDSLLSKGKYESNESTHGIRKSNRLKSTPLKKGKKNKEKSVMKSGNRSDNDEIIYPRRVRKNKIKFTSTTSTRSLRPRNQKQCYRTIKRREMKSKNLQLNLKKKSYCGSDVIYYCARCSEQFDSKKELSKHMKKTHWIKSFDGQRICTRFNSKSKTNSRNVETSPDREIDRPLSASELALIEEFKLCIESFNEFNDDLKADESDHIDGIDLKNCQEEIPNEICDSSVDETKIDEVKMTDQLNIKSEVDPIENTNRNPSESKNEEKLSVNTKKGDECSSEVDDDNLQIDDVVAEPEDQASSVINGTNCTTNLEVKDLEDKDISDNQNQAHLDQLNSTINESVETANAETNNTDDKSCVDCTDKFNLKDDVDNHVIQSHRQQNDDVESLEGTNGLKNDDKSVSYDCTEEYNSEDSLDSHATQSRKKKTSPQSEMEPVVKSRKNVEMSDNSEFGLNCARCSEKFSRTPELIQHIRTVHINSTVQKHSESSSTEMQEKTPIKLKKLTKS